MIIGIDFDDVTMNTFPEFLAHSNECHNEQFRVEEFVSFEYDTIWKISKEARLKRFIAFDNSAAKKNIQPMPGAIEVINKLAKIHHLHIITARPIEIAQGTHEIINRYFPEKFKGVHFCSTDNGANYHRPKPLICKEIGATMHIEDHPVTAAKCTEHGILTFLFDQPWNRSTPPHHFTKRVFSWEDIFQLLCQP